MTYLLTSLLCCDILVVALSCCFLAKFDVLLLLSDVLVDVPELVSTVDGGGDDVQGGHVRDAGGVSAAALLRVPEEKYDIQI